MDNYSYFCSRFQKEITRRYTRSCYRKCENLPDYNTRLCKGLRIQRGMETHLHYKVFSQPPVKDAVYGTTLLFLRFAQRGTGERKRKKTQ